MFKKAPKHPQGDLLSSADQHLDTRRQKVLHDPNGWQNTFYREIFLNINESIFKPIYDERMGAPNAPVNQLVAMIILKDGMGLSDEQLFEACRFHMLYRHALGCINLSDRIPTESTYYKFRRAVETYQREHQVDLFGNVFSAITSDQIIRFNLSGKQIRMDSKLIGSNIASYSRFELVHATMMKFYASLNDKAVKRMPATLAQQMAEMTKENADSLVYHSNTEQIKGKLGDLGRGMYQLLACYTRTDSNHYELLERVFNEQFAVESDQDDADSDSTSDKKNVIARPGDEISSDSVQSPFDPDCGYRIKAGKSTKGYSVNLTETIDEDELNLITDIQLEPAHCSDASFVEPSIVQTQKRLGHSVDICYADGAFNRSLEQENKDNSGGDGIGHVEMVLSGIQGPASRFELHQTKDGLQVTDTQTGRIHQATAVCQRNPEAEPKWRIIGENGIYRYFGQCEIRACEQRRLLKDKDYLERTRKRNNVEASIYHLTHTLKGAKTVYRGLIRTKIWSWARALWVNIRRIERYLIDQAVLTNQYATE
ncbi:MAG: transposase [Cyclonatronaceae bacterium]